MIVLPLELVSAASERWQARGDGVVTPPLVVTVIETVKVPIVGWLPVISNKSIWPCRQSLTASVTAHQVSCHPNHRNQLQ